ncbi:unnamed protein product [Caenorhabditis auriculariae]|uniref:CCHC-type domain-containing protein n=1 Tax=Caenorhabditis auriculariae TaxID=2777116 RepID=A0A8S1H7D3_9PELO|nr:unnamed protein product [Caenorhabditis auriculariae]
MNQAPLSMFYHTANLLLNHQQRKQAETKLCEELELSFCSTSQDSGYENGSPIRTTAPSICDEVENEVFELLVTMRQLPFRNYVCHRCGVPGHRIQYCPTRLVDAPTAYQGDRRSAGKFHCQRCDVKWMSENCYKDRTQKCRRCNTFILPHKMFPLSCLNKRRMDN